VRYLLDTDTCISILRGVKAVIARLQKESPDDCRVSAISAYELFAGAEKSRSSDTERMKVQRFLEVVEILSFDREPARQAGIVRARLEAIGTPIGPYDLLIAGHALSQDLILVTRNTREFQRVEGLQVETWG
jgi:tRNA(fMet)-specific endonuclease VapC